MGARKLVRSVPAKRNSLKKLIQIFLPPNSLKLLVNVLIIPLFAYCCNA